MAEDEAEREAVDLDLASSPAAALWLRSASCGIDRKLH